MVSKFNVSMDLSLVSEEEYDRFAKNWPRLENEHCRNGIIGTLLQEDSRWRIHLSQNDISAAELKRYLRRIGSVNPAIIREAYRELRFCIKRQEKGVDFSPFSSAWQWEQPLPWYGMNSGYPYSIYNYNCGPDNYYSLHNAIAESPYSFSEVKEEESDQFPIIVKVESLAQKGNYWQKHQEDSEINFVDLENPCKVKAESHECIANELNSRDTRNMAETENGEVTSMAVGDANEIPSTQDQSHLSIVSTESTHEKRNTEALPPLLTKRAPEKKDQGHCSGKKRATELNASPKPEDEERKSGEISENIDNDSLRDAAAHALVEFHSKIRIWKNVPGTSGEKYLSEVGENFQMPSIGFDELQPAKVDQKRKRTTKRKPTTRRRAKKAASRKVKKTTGPGTSVSKKCAYSKPVTETLQADQSKLEIKLESEDGRVKRQPPRRPTRAKAAKKEQDRETLLYQAWTVEEDFNLRSRIRTKIEQDGTVVPVGRTMSYVEFSDSE